MDKLLDLIRSWTPEQACIIWRVLWNLQEAVWDAHEEVFLAILTEDEIPFPCRQPEDQEDSFPSDPAPR